MQGKLTGEVFVLNTVGTNASNVFLRTEIQKRIKQDFLVLKFSTTITESGHFRSAPQRSAYKLLGSRVDEGAAMFKHKSHHQ